VIWHLHLPVYGIPRRVVRDIVKAVAERPGTPEYAPIRPKSLLQNLNLEPCTTQPQGIPHRASYSERRLWPGHAWVDPPYLSVQKLQRGLLRVPVGAVPRLLKRLHRFESARTKCPRVEFPAVDAMARNASERCRSPTCLLTMFNRRTRSTIFRPSGVFTDSVLTGCGRLAATEPSAHK